jgi:hypothetical protein
MPMSPTRPKGCRYAERNIRRLAHVTPTYATRTSPRSEQPSEGPLNPPLFRFHTTFDRFTNSLIFSQVSVLTGLPRWITIPLNRHSIICFDVRRTRSTLMGGTGHVLCVARSVRNTSKKVLCVTMRVPQVRRTKRGEEYCGKTG